MLSRLRAAAQTLAPPSVLEFWAGQTNETWSLDRPLARVVAREAAAIDATTLVLRPNRRWQGFVPGQHVNVTVEINGRRLVRSYSPSPVAGRPDCLAITVKAVPGGRVSTHLCQALKVGDVVELGAAYGEMRVPQVIGSASLLLAAGSGITPLMAMVRELASRGMPQAVTLFYWARARAELCFVDELRELARRFPQFTVRFGLTGESVQGRDEFAGRIDAATFTAIEPTGMRVFACGPAGFVDAAAALLGEQAQTFLAEAFTPPALAPVAAETGTVRVHLSRSGKTLEIARGRPLLDALEEQGVKPAFGCRMGLCNSCACPKAAGATRHLQNGTLESEPVSALRLCVNSATSDLVIEL